MFLFGHFNTLYARSFLQPAKWPEQKKDFRLVQVAMPFQSLIWKIFVFKTHLFVVLSLA
jgi:hypothetical protein